jgi:hypothetical protein
MAVKLSSLAWPLVPWFETQLDRAVRVSRVLPLLAYSPAIADGAVSWYYRGRGERPEPPSRELYPFEQRALERFFPKPPALLFVPGCGPGREPLALMELGYQVEALEPEPSSARRAQQELSGRALVHAERVQDWSRRPLPRRFDGIVSGWGMWSCVVEKEERLSILSAFRRSSVGPVLLSFWRAEPTFVAGSGSGSTGAVGRLEERVKRFRSRIGKPLPAGLAFYAGMYGHLVSEESLRSEAASSGYDVGHYERDGSVFPNAVLVPSAIK